MTLNTYQKRGSVMMLALPFRPWIFVPDGSISPEDRQSAEYYSSAVSFDAPADVAENPEPVLWRRRGRR